MASFILFDTTLDLPLGRIDADADSSALGPGQVAIPCPDDANPDDVELWREEAATLPEPTAEQQLEKARAAKLVEIIAGSNSFAAVVKARYSQLEVDSWAVQQTQAETVLSGGMLQDGSLLTVLAAANGVTLPEFAVRVMTNVATAEAVTKSIVAQQQTYETRLKSIMADDALNAAGKMAAIGEILVSYAMPDGDAPETPAAGDDVPPTGEA